MALYRSVRSILQIRRSSHRALVFKASTYVCNISFVECQDFLTPMGISSLWPHIAPAKTCLKLGEISRSRFAGSSLPLILSLKDKSPTRPVRVAVDASILIYRSSTALEGHNPLMRLRVPFLFLELGHGSDV